MPLCAAVLFRDDHLLAVAKPRGLPSIPHGGLYLNAHPPPPRPAPLARGLPHAPPGTGHLGASPLRPHPEARRAVTTAWREGRVEKSYRALVQGVPERTSSPIDVPIGPVPHPRLGRCTP